MGSPIYLRTIYRNNSRRTVALISALLFSSLTLFVTILHYQQKLTVNSTLWIFWLVSITAFIWAYSPSFSRIKNYWSFSIKKDGYLIFILTALFYFLIRVTAYKTSPLNNYGLFDDAAWAIVYAKNWILSDNGFFQPHFIDGGTSHESLFHYYVIALFKLFGFNLFVFNMGLFFLGFVAVLFTTLTIHVLFNRWWITALGATIMLTFPLHVTQTFMGHRYAIAMPVIMISYYYFVSGFKNQSLIQAVIGSIFLGLGLCAAPMGKQYLVAILLSIALSVIFCSHRISLIKRNFPLLGISFTALIISLIPLFCYIYFNPSIYLNREVGLITGGILPDYQTRGLVAITSRLVALATTFADGSYNQFMPGYPLIPHFYWLMLIPGMLIATYKKRWEIVIMCLLPAFVGFLTVPYDFRIQISTPFWIISMLYAINCIADLNRSKRTKLSLLLSIITLASISMGLLSASQFIKKVYSNPDYIMAMGFSDVAFARITQDMARGNELTPSSSLKKDEFNPIATTNNIDYDIFICPSTAFGVAHLFLQNLNVEQTLSFCHGEYDRPIPSRILGTPQAVFYSNIKALSQYKNSNKGLLLVWEVSDIMKPVVDVFKPFQKYGVFKTYHYTIDVDNSSHEVWSLKITKENVGEFLSEVKSLKL